MSGFATRVAALFVAPPGRPGTADEADTCSPPCEPPRVAIIGPPGTARPLAAAAAAELRRHGRAPAAMLLVWDPSGAPAAALPATPAAGALARRLAGRGLSSVAQGRLARVGLPADPGAAAIDAARAWAAVDVPTVLAIAGPRPAAFDPLLVEQQLLVVLDGDGSGGQVAALAADALAQLPGQVVVAAPLASVAGRALARAGFGRAAALRPALEHAWKRSP